MSQSLFYWNPFCNGDNMIKVNNVNQSRNPYFIGILSAIEINTDKFEILNSRNPYFIGILSAIRP